MEKHYIIFTWLNKHLTHRVFPASGQSHYLPALKACIDLFVEWVDVCSTIYIVFIGLALLLHQSVISEDGMTCYICEKENTPCEKSVGRTGSDPFSTLG